MGFTNFCCRSGGSNLNAGTRTGNTTEPGTSADFTYTAGNSNGTSVFTVASGNPQTDGVAVGDWGSVYLNAATTTAFIGRVTAVSTTTITFSTSAKSGSFPASGTGTVTCKIGGAWKGPNGFDTFPFAFIRNTTINGNAYPVRINLKNDATYSISTTLSYTNGDSVCMEGYSSSYGDSNLAVIDIGTSSSTILNFNAAGKIKCVKFTCSATSGSNNGITMNTLGAVLEKCVVTGARGSGIGAGTIIDIIGCELYGNNTSNSVSTGAITVTGNGVSIKNCIIHDNTGSNNSGIYATSAFYVFNTIFDTNTLNGIRLGSGFTYFSVFNCDFYNNGGSGIDFNSTAGVGIIRNSNFIKNGGYGINSTNLAYTTDVVNCGFGAGTMANTSGQTNGNAINAVGSITYQTDISPYMDAANGDFRIKLTESMNSGFNDYVQQASSYSGVVGCPSVGAVIVPRTTFLAKGGMMTGGSM
jgi:hypothetical protein